MASRLKRLEDSLPDNDLISLSDEELNARLVELCAKIGIEAPRTDEEIKQLIAELRKELGHESAINPIR
jgi:ribosomal protein L29